MTELTTDYKNSQISSQGSLVPGNLSYGVAAAKKIPGGVIAAVDSSGNAVSAGDATAVRVVGRNQRLVDNTSGSAGDLFAEIETGTFTYDTPSSGADQILAANALQVCYVIDNHTLGLTDGGGTTPRMIAGVIMGVVPSGEPEAAKVKVSLGALSASAIPSTGATSRANYARAVATSIGAYGGTGTGTLTESSNGALAAQDGITMVAGDVIFLPEGLTNVTAADAGPWVISSLGGASSKWVFKRPDWWAHGSTILESADVTIGTEGTAFDGSAWKSFVATATKVVGTDAPAFWPRRQMFTVTLAGGTSLYVIGTGGGGEALYLRSATKSMIAVTQDTHAGTLGTSRIECPVASRTIGVQGTAHISINSINDNGGAAGSDTSTVMVEVRNW